MVDDTSDGHSRKPPSEAEVQELIHSIKETSSSSAPRPTTDCETTDTPPHELDEFDEGEYWDYSSMAPLNATSAVSSITPS